MAAQKKTGSAPPEKGLISTYGLFWKRSEVNWGYGKKANLKGRLSQRSKPVDFCDQQGVYVLYDGNFRIVYIGQTKNEGLLKRLNQHTKSDLAERWERFSWFGLKWVLKNPTDESDLSILPGGAGHPTTVTVLNHLEAVLLATVEPPHNRQGARFGKKVKRYLQCPK